MSAKNRVATQQGHLEGKLSRWGDVAPIKNQRISSDSPVCKTIIRKHAKVTPDHFQEPVAFSNRFIPLYTVDEVSDKVNVENRMHYTDHELSDLECGLDILELNLNNSLNVTNYDKFDKILFKKTSGSKSCLSR